MTTVEDLGQKIAGYLQQTTDVFFVNGVDLLLDAINKARQYAQMQRDFELSKLVVDVSVSLTSGTFVSPAWRHGFSDDSNLVAVKKILAAYFPVTNPSGLRPIQFINKSTETASERRRYGWNPWAEFSNANAFPQTFSPYNTPALVQEGVNLTLFPADITVFGGSDPVLIVCDAVRYFPDQLANGQDEVDFLMQFGDDFLFWDAVSRLNYLGKEYVPREEGNIVTPYKERDEAWTNLLQWDNSLTYSGDTSLSLD